MPRTTPNEDELLRLMAAGNEEAFVTIYRQRQGGVYRFALHMSGSASIAEEVTQEVFLVLIREGRQYDPGRGSLSAYLYGIARNHVLRYLEKDRSYVPLADEGQDGDGCAPAALAAWDDPLEELARQDRIELVRRAVLALPPNYREVVVLCDLHGMSYAETAVAAGCAVGTVRSRLHRGRALLVEKLGARLRAGGPAPSRCLV